MEDELTIRGSLEESSLPELLNSICKSKESGVLTCSDGEHIKSIYLNDGLILSAISSNPDDRLGESLLRYGKITVDHYLEASKLIKPGRKLGQILCEMNALGTEELIEAIRRQVRDIIRNLFRITKGQYELVLKPIDAQEMVLLSMTTEDIIFEGVKTDESWSRISKGLGSFQTKIAVVEEANAILLNLSLSADESHILSLCGKGQLTVQDICTVSYLTNFETCRILWGFILVGILKLTEPAGQKSGEPEKYLPTSSQDMEYELHDLVEGYNDIYAYIFDFAFQKIGDDAAGIAGKAMTMVQDAMPNLARNLTLDNYGRLDFDAVLRNLAPIPENVRMELLAGALEELVYALLFEIGAHFGPDQQKQLTKDIQKLRKH